MTLKPGCVTCEHVADVRGIDLTQPTPEAVPPRDPAAWPTPEQFVDEWEKRTPQARLALAERIIHDAQMASECFRMDHKTAIRAADSALAELRRKVDGFGLEWIYEAQP